MNSKEALGQELRSFEAWVNGNVEDVSGKLPWKANVQSLPGS